MRGAEYLIPPARFIASYARALLAGVDPCVAARLAQGVQSNHPAWVYGHLAWGADAAMSVLRGPDRARLAPLDRVMFDYRSRCLDDPDGRIYPALETMTTRFFALTADAISALEAAPEARLSSPNPTGVLLEEFPTVGALVAYLLVGHPMVHLGQVSAWRRHMGLEALAPVLT